MTTIVAGIRALLMQALHPGALAGVYDHSRFREDPWDSWPEPSGGSSLSYGSTSPSPMRSSPPTRSGAGPFPTDRMHTSGNGRTPDC